MNKKLWLLLFLLLAGCVSVNKQIDDQISPDPTASTFSSFDERVLTDTVGDVHPPFIDVVSTRISQVEDGFIEIEFTVNGDIPLSPDPSYGNVIYKIWVDRNYDTTYPAHCGGNAEYVFNIAYYNDVNANAWEGVLFDCALGTGETAFKVTIGGVTASARIPLSLIGNPSSFRYSYESFTDSSREDGDANAMMDQITLNYNVPIGQTEKMLTPDNKPTPTALPTPTSTPTYITPSEITCAGAFTRLKPDIWAIVTSGDLPNRVRTLPGTTADVITTIYPGTIVKIVEGPVCKDGLIFWKIENDSIPGGIGWTAEGDGNNYWLEPYTYLQDLVPISAYGVSFKVPGSWSTDPQIVHAGSDEMCTWPEHIKITLTTYGAQSEWYPVIYVYATDKQPNWYPLCPGAPLLRVRQQTLSYGERELFASENARPIFNSALIYGYIGKTPDGQYTIFAFFPVNFPLLAYSFQNLYLPPGGIPFNLENELSAQDWSAYYQEVGKQLEAASDSDFTPDLDLLDAIAETITVTTP